MKHVYGRPTSRCAMSCMTSCTKLTLASRLLFTEMMNAVFN